MDWKLMLSTLGIVFLAELGDKTQLAALSLAAKADSKWAIFVGSSLALIATSAIAVLTGDAISRVVPPIWIRRGAGALFIVLGVFFLIGRSE